MVLIFSQLVFSLHLERLHFANILELHCKIGGHAMRLNKQRQKELTNETFYEKTDFNRKIEIFSFK